jgi:Mg-chelatase subunit ChlD
MNLPRRPLAALVCANLLLSSCSVTAQARALWPQPRPDVPPAPITRMAPDFQAPSATHCARPVTMREVPGRSGQPPYGSSPLREELAKSGRALGDLAAADRIDSGPASRAESRSSAAPAAPALQRTRPAPFAPDGPQQGPQPSAAVTAGVIDDNADFGAYLAFRDRNPVVHRPRDVRERYLLQVRDSQGRGVADAEVAVQAPSGHAMWARTDGGGRAWLHPDAFDASRSGSYDVIARKGGRQAWARLARGQKNAVDVVLDAAPAPAQARLDLLFLVDATGSMADEIDKLKATLRTITAEVARLPSRPDICLGLVAYRDRGDQFLLRSHDFSNDVGAFLQQALAPLRAAGGGDYPEAMNEALHEAVHQLSWRGEGATRMVILLADAPPHLDYGAPHYDDDMLAALGKGIRIFGVGASGLDRQGEFIQRQIAQYTGGKFVFLTYADARQPGRGPGAETTHDVQNYSVDTLDRLVVRLVTDELAKAERR